jgi:hypothetical protein
VRKLTFLAVASLGCITLAAACSDMVAPMQAPPGAPAPRGPSAAVSLAAVPADWQLLGTYVLPAVDRDSGSNALPYTSVGVSVPKGTWFRVFAQGTVTFERNPHYMACQPPGCTLPLEGRTVGPMGNGQLDVGIGFQSGLTPVTGGVSDRAWWRDFTQAANPTEVNFLWQASADLNIWVKRTSTDGTTCLVSTCFAPSTSTKSVWVPAYKAPGSITLYVYKVPPPGRVTADRQWVSTTDSVTFTGSTDGPRQTDTGADAAIAWTFSPADTGATPNKVFIQSVSACAGQLTCRFKPGLSGRMWMSTQVEGRSVDLPSPVVWRDGPRLALSCTAAVTRGQQATCTASAVPATATLAVTAWRFVGGGITISPPPGDAQNTATSWAGRMVVSGSVTVSASVAGRPLTASATVTVNPRGWRGAIAYPAVSGPIATDSALLYPPPMPAPGVVQHGVLGKFTYPPVMATYSDGSGPNEGWFYVDLPVFPSQPVIYVNAGLYPGDPFYQAQTGGSGYCAQADMDVLRASVTQHEQGHYDLESTYYTGDSFADRTEAVVLYEAPSGPHRSPAQLDSVFLQPFVDELQQLQSQYDSTHVVSLTCTYHPI